LATGRATSKTRPFVGLQERTKLLFELWSS